MSKQSKRHMGLEVPVESAIELNQLQAKDTSGITIKKENGDTAILIDSEGRLNANHVVISSGQRTNHSTFAGENAGYWYQVAAFHFPASSFGFYHGSWEILQGGGAAVTHNLTYCHLNIALKQQTTSAGITMLMSSNQYGMSGNVAYSYSATGSNLGGPLAKIFVKQAQTYNQIFIFRNEVVSVSEPDFVVVSTNSTSSPGTLVTV